MLLAARLGFRQVIGIEFSQDLVTRAKANLRAAQAHLRCPAIIMVADSASYEPPADSSVLFFHNPFAGSILAGALEGIRRSFDACPRPLRLVCNLPFESAFEAEIRQQPWLSLVAVMGEPSHYIAPGMPVQNAFAESCILRLRDELLNAVPLTAMSRLKEKAKPPSD
jgi:Integrase core domain